MEIAMRCTIFLAVTSSVTMELLPAALLLSIVPAILSAETQKAPSQDHAIVFNGPTNYYSHFDAQRRGQPQNANINLNDQTSVITTQSQSFQLPTQMSQSNSQNILQYGETQGKIPNVQQPQQNQIYNSVQNQYVSPSLNQHFQIIPNQQLNQPIRPVEPSRAQSQVSLGHVPLRGESQEKIEENVQGNGDSQIPVRNASPASTSVTGFGLGIMKVLDKSLSGNNVVSPYSIALVLALLQQGTRGAAQEQISRALGMNSLQAKETFRHAVSVVKNRRSRNTLNIATGVFFSDAFDVSRQYKLDAVEFFSSDLTSLNFNNPMFAASFINEWVSKSTQGHIPFIVSPDIISSETLMILANAVFFKGLWNETFNPERTVKRPFYLSDGVAKQTDFMHNSGSFKSGKDQRLDADFIVMPFEGHQYSLISIVPSAKSDVSSLLQNLSHEDILKFLMSPKREVVISMPKFSIRLDTNLGGPLKALGISDIFTKNSGLSALGNSQGDQPRVTSAVHSAVITIDEKGGSAAATTLLAVSTLSIDFNELEFRFSADKPFVCILWDHELNVPLFISKISDPTVGK